MYSKKNNIPISFSPFIRWAYAPYKWWVLLYFCFCFLAGLYGVFSAYLLKVIVDTLSAFEGQRLEIMALVWPMVFFLLNYELYYLSWRGIYYVNLNVLPRVKNKIIMGLFNQVMQHSNRFFQDNLSGAISNNIQVLVSNLEKIVYYPLYTVILGFTQLVVAIFIMASVSVVFSIGLLIWAIFFICISLYFSRRVRVLSNGYAASNAQCFGKILDSVGNVTSVRFFANRRFESEYLSHYLDEARAKFQSKEFFLLKFSFCQGFSISALLAFVVFFLIRLKMNHLVTIGDFAFILTLVLDVVMNVRTLTEQADIINDVIGQCKQSLQALVVPLEIADAPDARELQVTQGAIVFNKVSFEYHGSRVLFREKNLVIPAGQKVGLVGYSGSGKSTFVHLILRLFDVESGSISIDGQDIRMVTQDSLREQIGIIPQEFSLFHRTIMENIRYGRINASDEEVIEAAKQAHAHDFIMNFPLGYQTLVGEYGSKLSGGQRQRIALARVILKNAPILILDEATSQLDSLSEGKMQESLLNVMRGKTTIVVAHRLFTLMSMDRILVFQDGVVVEDGTHQDLLHKGGFYTSIWHAQTGGMIPEQLV